MILCFSVIDQFRLKTDIEQVNIGNLTTKLNCGKGLHKSFILSVIIWLINSKKGLLKLSFYYNCHNNYYGKKLRCINQITNISC